MSIGLKTVASYRFHFCKSLYYQNRWCFTTLKQQLSFLTSTKTALQQIIIHFLPMNLTIKYFSPLAKFSVFQHFPLIFTTDDTQSPFKSVLKGRKTFQLWYPPPLSEWMSDQYIHCRRNWLHTAPRVNILLKISGLTSWRGPSHS